MTSLRTQRPDYTKFIPLKELDLNVSIYTTRNLEKFPSTDLDLFDIHEELRKLDSRYRIPSFPELIKSIRTLKDIHPNIKAAILVVRTERTSDVLCWPNKNWDYAPGFIEPRLLRGKPPILIRGADFEKRGNKKIIKGGERIELPNYPKTSGELKRDIKELELSKGDHIFNKPYKMGEKPRGLRNLMVGGFSPSFEKVYANAVFSPWDVRNSIEYRLCTDRIPEASL